MRFFKEFNGFIFEFNSVGEYLEFLAGRVMAIIVIIGIILLVIWGQQGQVTVSHSR